ncbi:MAG: hypothetical protein ACM3PT_05135 [Deltaproteobacteria bacterium]
MDLSTIIMAIIILGICILPFAIIYFNSQKKKAGLVKILQALASKNNAVISRYDLWKSNGIGFDENKKHAFFFISGKDGIKEFNQKLSEIKKCRIDKHGRSIKSSGGSYSVIDKLDLVFENENSIVSSFPFFDSAQSMQLTNELEIATKWEKIFKEAIK